MYSLNDGEKLKCILCDFVIPDRILIYIIILKLFIHFNFLLADHMGTKLYNVKVLKYVKGKLSDSFTNYNYVGNTKVSVSIKKT